MEHAVRPPYHENNLDRERHVVDHVAAARIEREYQAAKASYPRKEVSFSSLYSCNGAMC